LRDVEIFLDKLIKLAVGGFLPTAANFRLSMFSSSLFISVAKVLESLIFE
jgi:hypothetical protein